MSRSGAYVSWLLDPACGRAVNQWCRGAGMTHPLPVGDHHCTIMYSPERMLDPDCHGTHPLPSPWTHGGYVIRGGQRAPRLTDSLGPRDGKGALVVVLDSAAMRERHRFFRDDMGLEHSFPDFVPHLTLSYDCNAQDPAALLRMVREPLPVPLVFMREKRDYCS